MKIKQSGFTLIELMIVVAIIGALAAIAYPSYQGYIERTNRADAMSELQQMASRIESSKIVYKRYDRIPLNEIAPAGTALVSGQFDFPLAGNALYTISVWNVGVSPATQVTGNTLSTRQWQLRATPVATARMNGDGNLTIDHNGQKCRAANCGTNDEWRD